MTLVFLSTQTFAVDDMALIVVLAVVDVLLEVRSILDAKLLLIVFIFFSRNFLKYRMMNLVPPSRFYLSLYVSTDYCLCCQVWLFDRDVLDVDGW